MDIAVGRRTMVETQLADRGIADERVLEAFRAVPREAFVSPELRKHAFADGPLDIGLGQTISQPYVVARMIEAVGENVHGRVLEVGTGSGYAAAILSQLAKDVVTIERIETLARSAAELLERLGLASVVVVYGDGSIGYAPRAPYDAILVSAGGPCVPPSLTRQLAIGGTLVIPVGREVHSQHLVRVTRTAADSFQAETLDPVVFVPLIGHEGWAPQSRD